MIKKARTSKDLICDISGITCLFVRWNELTSIEKYALFERIKLTKEHNLAGFLNYVKKVTFIIYSSIECRRLVKKGIIAHYQEFTSEKTQEVLYATKEDILGAIDNKLAKIKEETNG